MTDLGTSLVIVDEVHGIDRSRASHAQQSDQLKYFMDHVPATLVLAGINVENCGFFNGHSGEQLARRFTTLKVSPSSYSTIPQRQEWALLVEGFERALRLHAHKPGRLLPSPTTSTAARAATSSPCPTSSARPPSWPS
jgi:hypothetical protein